MKCFECGDTMEIKHTNCCEEVPYTRSKMELQGLIEDFILEGVPAPYLKKDIEIVFTQGYEDEQFLFMNTDGRVECLLLETKDLFQTIKNNSTEGKAVMVDLKEHLEAYPIIVKEYKLLKDGTNEWLPKDIVDTYTSKYTPWDVEFEVIEGDSPSCLHSYKDLWVKKLDTQVTIKQANTCRTIIDTEKMQEDGTSCETLEQRATRFNSEILEALEEGRFVYAKVNEVEDIVLDKDCIVFTTPDKDYLEDRGIVDSDCKNKEIPLGILLNLPKGYELRVDNKGFFIKINPKTQEAWLLADQIPDKVYAKVSSITYDQYWLHHTDHAEATRLYSLPDEELLREKLFSPMMLCKPGEFRYPKDDNLTEELLLFHSLNSVGKVAYLLVSSKDFKKDLDDFLKPHLNDLELALENKLDQLEN